MPSKIGPANILMTPNFTSWCFSKMDKDSLSDCPDKLKQMNRDNTKSDLFMVLLDLGLTICQKLYQNNQK